MFVTLQGGNYTANLYLFLAIYPLYDKENSEKFESQFQCFLKFSQTVGSTFNYLHIEIQPIEENTVQNEYLGKSCPYAPPYLYLKL